MTSIAITETITSIAEAEKRFNLCRSSLADFFPEWKALSLTISDSDRADLNTLGNRYIYHRSAGHLLENMVMLLLISPLLAIAGFY
ncbi:MAG: type I restriction endonuclease subunit R, partial [Microcystaceae cyanobacterium]